MGILSRLERRKWNPTDDRYYKDLGVETNSGARVDVDRALNYSAVYRAISLLSNTVAMLPLPVYRRLDNSEKERSPQHPLFRILHDKPNPEQSSFNYRSAIQGHLLLWGNAYSEIERDNMGNVKALWPLNPARMTVKRKSGHWLSADDERDQIDHSAGSLIYEYRLSSGELKNFSSAQIFHLRGFSINGLIGYSPIRIARESIGLGLATEEAGARLFGQGMKPGGILTHPGKLGDVAYKRLKKDMNRAQSGLSNMHRLMILEDGVQWNQVGIPPEDAQFLETRKFQVIEIARWYGLPPHKLMDLERATFSNIEHQSIEFVTDSVMPWLVNWESAIQNTLFMEEEYETHFAEFLIAGLLRGDTATRYAAYAVGRQWGWLSANDIRRLENMNSIGEEGEQYLVPLNMVPASSVGDIPEGDGDQRIQTSKESRSSTARRRLGEQYQKIFKDAAGKVVRREVNDIRKAMKKYLDRRNVPDFMNWLEEFYRTHPLFMERQMLPVFLTYAESIQVEASGEIGDAVEEMTPEVEEFVRAYMETFTVRHVGSSINQLRKLILETEEAGEDVNKALDERLNQWEEERPGRIAKRETVQSGNAIARAVFIMGGITHLVWRAHGENCPFCNKLNGKTVGIREHFASKGETFEGDDPEKKLITRTNIAHPPIHSGCDCTIEPV